MDPSALGQLVAIVAVVGFFAWVILRAIVRTVRFNVIKKRDGAEAAQQYWNAKNRKKKRPPSLG
ncbi:hypothetical protein ACIQTT_02565 [Microbacterium sp. NPDC090225]|uniref:hypothetical protein n=1 Tax=Microbacterium sp. NPDC090225 TaxID=3364207 RepID=UPI00382831CF